MAQRPELSLIIPIFNEEAVLDELHARLSDLLDKLALPTEVVFVDDGSKDASLSMLKRLASAEPRYKVLSFSRNFGHQRAITAGMDLCRGQAAVVMDADLQDPPEVILEMVAKWREGYDVVYGKRRSRAGEGVFKLLTAKLFYRAFASMIPIKVPLDTGDFRLMSRRVLDAMRGLGESHRFVRGLVAWVGYKQVAVEYDRHARFAGETKYPLKKMLAFAADGITSFSVFPLKLATYAGVFVALGSVLYAAVAVYTHFVIRSTVPGWTTTVVVVSFLASVQLLLLGVLGAYVGRIYEEVKARPLYVVAERVNFERGARRVRGPGKPRTRKRRGASSAPPELAPATETPLATPAAAPATQDVPTMRGLPVHDPVLERPSTPRLPEPSSDAEDDA